MSPFWTFCTRAPPPASRMNEHTARECSALREVHIVLDTNKTYPKLRDCLFSFNLNLDLFILALENLYFNTLDRGKSAGEEFGLYKKSGDTSPTYTHTGSHRIGMKEPHAAREPRVADPCPMHKHLMNQPFERITWMNNSVTHSLNAHYWHLLAF